MWQSNAPTKPGNYWFRSVTGEYPVTLVKSNGSLRVIADSPTKFDCPIEGILGTWKQRNDNAQQAND